MSSCADADSAPSTTSPKTGLSSARSTHLVTSRYVRLCTSISAAWNDLSLSYSFLVCVLAHARFLLLQTCMLVVLSQIGCCAGCNYKHMGTICQQQPHKPQAACSAGVSLLLGRAIPPMQCLCPKRRHFIKVCPLSYDYDNILETCWEPPYWSSISAHSHLIHV